MIGRSPRPRFILLKLSPAQPECLFVPNSYGKNRSKSSVMSIAGKRTDPPNTGVLLDPFPLPVPTVQVPVGDFCTGFFFLGSQLPGQAFTSVT